MESRWNRIGNYPLMSYFNGKGNELTLQFFDGVGGMLVAFSNPSDALVNVCGPYCGNEMAANGKDIKRIIVDFQHMYSPAHTRYVVDAIFQQYAFDDIAKKEIQDCMNSFYSREHNNRVRYGFGLFAPTPKLVLFKEMAAPSNAWF